jgi:hypothetical protein
MKKGTKVRYVIPDIVGTVVGSQYSEEEGRVVAVKVEYTDAAGAVHTRAFSVADPALQVEAEASDEQH